MFRRGTLTQLQAGFELKKMGVRSDTVQKQILKLSETLADRGTLDELRRRDKITHAQWSKHIAALGFPEATVDMLYKAVSRLLDPATLIPAMHRGFINRVDCSKEL
ncbi:unnamed protein product, partial [marine sediment metagenome]